MTSDQRDPIADFLARADLRDPPPSPLSEAIPENGPQIDESRDVNDASEVLEDQSSLIDELTAAERGHEHDIDLSRFDDGLPPDHPLGRLLDAETAEEVEAPNGLEEQTGPEGEHAAPATAGGLMGMLRSGLDRARRRHALPPAPRLDATSADAAEGSTSRSGLQGRKKDGVAPRKVALVAVAVLIAAAGIVAKMQGTAPTPPSVSLPLLDESGTGLSAIDDVYTHQGSADLLSDIALPEATAVPDDRLVAVEISPPLDLSTPPVFAEIPDVSAVESVLPLSAHVETPELEEDGVTVQVADVAATDRKDGAEEAPAAAPAPRASPSPVQQARAQSQPTPGAAGPRRRAAARSGDPQVTVHGVMVSPDCWSCGASAVLGTRAGSVVVNNGDTWNGYRVRIAGDLVTLSDSSGQWSFLPER